LRSKKELAAEQSQETHFLSNEEKEKWIEDFLERETAVARKRVQDAETVIMQDMTTAENKCMTSGKPEKTFKEMLYAIGDSLSDLASSNDEQDWEDEEDDEEHTELGEHSDDDEPRWMIGTITKTVQHHMESFRQKQIISKKHFRLGGLGESEWTRSVRAVRDTPVSDYSAHGVNTTHQVAYRPPIAVLPFLLALSVSYFKQTLWRCGQL